MLFGRIGRRLVLMAGAALACGIVLAHSALAQRGEDAAALSAEAIKLYQAGKYAEAEPLFKRSLAIYERTLGAGHASVGAALYNLARLYQTQGRYADAETAFRRSLVIREKGLGSKHPDVGTTLDDLGRLYQAQGRSGDAEAAFRRSLAVRERALGPRHRDVGISLNDLAGLYVALGRTAEAEPLYKRSLAIYEKSFGTEHQYVDTSLTSLARLYQAQARNAEAEPLFKRALAIRERTLGPEHLDVAILLNSLGQVFVGQGRYAEAESLFQRSLAIREKAQGPEHADVAQSLNNLATLHQAQGRYAEAEAAFRRSLAIWEKALGPEHSRVGAVLNNLASLYQAQGRYAEAEALYKRSLANWEVTFGLEHPDTGRSLNNLADLYQTQGRYAEAEAAFKRSLAIWEKTLGSEHREVGTALNNLANVYVYEGRHAEAEPLLKRTLAIWEKALGPEHHDVGAALNNLAQSYRAQGRYREAEPLYQRSLAIFERALGPEHPSVAYALDNMGELYRIQGRYAEAESLFRRGLAIRERALGPGHPLVGASLNSLATLALVRGDPPAAAGYWRRATSIIERQAGRSVAGGRAEASTGKAQHLASQFWGLIKATHRFRAQGAGPTATVAAEMFEIAQWAQGSDAAASLVQMAARSAAGSPQLASVVRERQDLVGEWQAKDKLLIASKSADPAKRKPEAEKLLAERLAAIDARLADIDRRLAEKFPDYTALVSPAPLSVTDVQAQLGADEALVLFLDTDDRFKPLPEESFIWVVTKSEVRWVHSDLGAAALSREVTALRCGLDADAWEGKGAERCGQALGIQPGNEAPSPLPFDHARAHALYQSLFGEVQDLIENKHLLIVPSGALTQLPFQVLITEAPASSDHRAAAWLLRKHAITVLPAVSSLKALRRVGRSSAPPRPLIGFGNPLLNGPDALYAVRAALARERQRCPATVGQQVAAHVALRGGVPRVETRGGLADLSSLKMQIPLPETADELCAVAQDVKAEASDIRLGAQATEHEVKRLSASGELAQYRIVHFATHGALAGQLTGTREPGLILTPPETASEEDDGYLSASEIAGLKLDADWVILSACNTAAGAATNAEALSGLGRAFIYAQARALLVSHWSVYSDATVKLVTGAVGEMAHDARVGRAEALRRAMLALIEKGKEEEVHPAFWAPFVVVGEGAGAAAR